MSSQESLKAGNLDEALSKLQDEVRKDPSNLKHRTFLFQLLAVLGQWDRALTQLNVAAEMDASCLMMAAMYRPALQAEALRTEIAAGKRSPLIFGEPDDWIASLVQASQMEGQGQLSESESLRGKALENAPTTSGTIDGKPFEWIADADSRMGPMFEAITNGSLYWIPFTRVKQIQIEEPADLRDMVWISATIIWANGGEAFALLPVRYTGSEQSGDGQVQLSRKTDWVDKGSGIQRGLGQKLFATDEDDFPLLSIRQIVLDVELEDSGPSSETT
jgi:type VI secretion system protein ImpE